MSGDTTWTNALYLHKKDRAVIQARSLKFHLLYFVTFFLYKCWLTARSKEHYKGKGMKSCQSEKDGPS